MYSTLTCRMLRNDIQGPFIECMLPTKLLLECMYCTIVVEVNENPECKWHFPENSEVRCMGLLFVEYTLEGR